MNLDAIINRCHFGDALDVLQTLPDGIVQTCVTSPPYWGLRDYGTATWEGGDPACDHKMNHGIQGKTVARANRTFTGEGIYKDTCGKCGAQRIDRQLGLEATPEEYVARIVEIFREVRRVLRPDGTLWLNLGDSYISTPSGSAGNNSGLQSGKTTQQEATKRPGKIATGYKTKDLVGIPWMVAFALRADGWYLRQDIIWAKPNPMPESVRDRCTKSHEYVFLLSKSERYFYDSAAIAEPLAQASIERLGQPTLEQQVGSARVPGKTNGNMKAVVKPPRMGGTKYGDDERPESANEWNPVGDLSEATRNKRSVWTVPTQPYSGAHFATYPPALILPCILAGSRPGDIVLDPFLGSGTTAQVAQETGRQWIGIDLNPNHLALQEERTLKVGLL